jgi:protein phosphatase
MRLTVPELSLVVLMGPSGSGKSSFARKHFRQTEILSSDICRGLVSDDENNQEATKDAFETLHYIAAKRLARGLLTVVDATNVQPESRKPLVTLARDYHCLPVAIALNLPEKLCMERNASRPDRTFGPHVVRQQNQQLRRSLRGLGREGFRHVHVLESQEEVDAAVIERQPLWNNRKSDHGPFDIIGDVHGCFDELTELLTSLGYSEQTGGAWAHPRGRRMLFVGDLVDRGPKSPEVVRLAMESVKSGSALAVPGNHDIKFMRKAFGKDVQITHGLAESLMQFEDYEKDYRGFSRVAAEFFDSLISHYVFDDGNLVVAHAGMKESMQGRGSGRVREFALFGETTGETDEFGLPVRYNWAAEYRGKARVIYGHTPIPEPEWVNRTLNIDTGCVFGGKLTALRYPELEVISVPAKQTYAEPARPFITEEQQAPNLSIQQQLDDTLDLADVRGKRIIGTRLMNNVTVREENATAALEVMSRFAVNPKWLIYLPPTMSPPETSRMEGFLEHPSEAFSYYRNDGVPKVICEKKHMGSRAVLVICQDEEGVQRRFGIPGSDGDGIGIVYTRTGRRFFEDRNLEQRLLVHVRDTLENSGFWEEQQTDWACFDCELMPWSAKAQELIRQQYASVGAAGRSALPEAVGLLSGVAGRGEAFAALHARYQQKLTCHESYVRANRHYCWPVNALSDFKLAAFHLLATEGRTHTNRDHLWHMETIRKVCEADESGLLLATPYRIIDLLDESSLQNGIDWWLEETGQGGEGMVVKPLDFVAKGRRGIAQPAVKCRGQEYLRIIYGPEYSLLENLERLRKRGLSAKRSLALREFALGVEGLERFVRKEPLRRVHECVFGVLALESEPVDPRL